MLSIFSQKTNNGAVSFEAEMFPTLTKSFGKFEGQAGDKFGGFGVDLNDNKQFDEWDSNGHIVIKLLDKFSKDGGKVFAEFKICRWEIDSIPAGDKMTLLS